MKVEREGDRIRIYSDVDKMLPLISMKLEVARKLYSELGEALYDVSDVSDGCWHFEAPNYCDLTGDVV